MTPAASLRAIPDSSWLSPELALVDPELAARARERLPDPGVGVATLGRRPRGAGDESVIVADDRLDLEADAAFRRLANRSVALPVQDVDDHRRRPRVRVVGLAVALPALVALTGLSLSSWIAARSDSTAVYSVDRQPTLVATVRDVTTGARPDQADVVRPRRPTPYAPAASTPAPDSGLGGRRLAWAPAPGASGYHVELFRGSSRVFSVDTIRPATVVPAAWSFDGRTQRLRPGEYKWYVWPTVSGRRGAQAIVQATLDIRR